MECRRTARAVTSSDAAWMGRFHRSESNRSRGLLPARSDRGRPLRLRKRGVRAHLWKPRWNIAPVVRALAEVGTAVATPKGRRAARRERAPIVRLLSKARAHRPGDPPPSSTRPSRTGASSTPVRRTIGPSSTGRRKRGRGLRTGRGRARNRGPLDVDRAHPTFSRDAPSRPSLRGRAGSRSAPGSAAAARPRGR